MKLQFLLLLPLAITLASCGGETKAEAMEDDMEDAMENGMENMNEGMDNAAGADAATMGYYQETVSAVTGAGGDLTALPPAAAVANIDGWISRLEGKDGTYEIVEGLKELKEELTDDDGIDGTAVGTVLNSLGEDIAEMNNTALAPLSNALTAAGQKLGGM